MSWDRIVHSLTNVIMSLMYAVALTQMLEFPPKRKTTYILTYMLAGLALEMVFDNLLKLHTANAVIQLLLYFGTVFYFSCDKPVRKLFAAALVNAALMVSETIATGFLQLGGGSVNLDGSVNVFDFPVLYFQVALLCELVYLAMLFIVVIAWNKILRKSGELTLLWFVLFPLSQALVFWWGTVFLTERNGTFGQSMTFLVFGLVGFAADGVMLLAIRKLLEDADARRQAEFLQVQLEHQRGYYDHVLRDAEAAAKLRHDMRNQLSAAYALMERGETDEARRQLDGLTSAVAATEPYCANTIVDAVVREKAGDCAASGISLDCGLDLPADCPLDGRELCSIFSNIMDNAISACRACGGPSGISLRAGIRGDYLVVRCENTAPPEAPAAKKTRSVSAPHGWGISILEDIARRYDGKLETQRADAAFTTTLYVKT